MIIELKRGRKTSDGIFGTLTVWEETPLECTMLMDCFTVENLEHAILPGEYEVTIDFSNRLKRLTPHIIVPIRDRAAGGDAGIRVHPSNFANQLLGCVAVGDRIENNAVLDSKKTFLYLMSILQWQRGMKIIVTENFLT